MTIAVLEALTFGLGRMVAAADAAGERLCLLTGNRDVYRHELAGLDPAALDIVDVDTHDTAACAAALKALPELRGLVNTTDTWLVPGADLAAQLGLPGPDPAAVRTLRDKIRVRALLHGHGLSRDRAVAVPAGPAAAAVVRENVGLPAVLKDSAGTGSRNVWLARDPAELDTALGEAARRRLTGRLLAEPLLRGPLYSAETVGWEGETRLLGVTGRVLSARWFGREELLSFPVQLPGTERAGLADWVARVLRAAGHTTGFAHVEFVRTADGPELVEINCRIGGCLAGEALCRSLGTNVYAAMIDIALGRRPALLDAVFGASRTGPTATALVYPERPGTFTGIAGLDDLAEHPGDPRWHPTMVEGTRVEELGDQRASTGLLLAEGTTTEIALYNALSAARTLRPVMAP